MIRLQIILLLIIGMITINGCGCEESTQRHLFFKIYNEDIAQSGFKVIETNEIKSKRQSLYYIQNTYTEENYSVKVDEFETTEDAINSFNIVLRQKQSDLSLNNKIVYGKDNERYTLHVYAADPEFENAKCITEEIFDLDGAFIESTLSCISQKRKFMFYFKSSQKNSINLSVIRIIGELYMGKVK